MLIYSMLVLLVYLAAMALGLYAWWDSGHFGIGFVLFLLIAAVAAMLGLPLTIGNLIADACKRHRSSV